MKNPLNRILSLTLAMCLAVASPISAYADNDNTEQTVVTTEDGQGEATEEKTTNESAQPESADTNKTESTEEKTESTEETESTDTKAEDVAASTEEQEEDSSAEEDSMVAVGISDSFSLEDLEEQTFSFENDEVVITVTGTAEDFGDAVDIQVTPITSGNDYDLINKKLEDMAEAQTVSIVGFLAYDITLLDADGNEVEPSDAVSVKMVNKVSPVDEENVEDVNEVGVVHFEQDENESAVVSEDANAVDISEITSVETGDDVTTAEVEFETVSFSVYAMTWRINPAKTTKVGSLVWEVGDDSKTLNLYAVDAYGRAIFNQRVTGTVSANTFKDSNNLGAQNLTFESLASQITVDGYTFSGAYRYASSSNSQYTYNKITNVSYNSANFCNGWAVFEYSKTEWTNLSNQNDTYNVYLMYTCDNPNMLYDGAYGTITSDTAFESIGNYNSDLKIYYCNSNFSLFQYGCTLTNSNESGYNQVGYVFEKSGTIKLTIGNLIDALEIKSVTEGWKGTEISPNDDGTYSINIDVNSTKEIYIVLGYPSSEYATDANTKVVSGATIERINDTNNNSTSGFKFNTGSGSESYNACNFGKAYQGLATTKIAEGVFTLNSTLLSTVNNMFPSDYSTNSDKYSYISSGSYHTNVDVTFTQDTDGYYVVDSKNFSYTYNSQSNALVRGTANEGFWPYGKDETHFGMILPISFSIDSTGKTDGKDTVFQFSGDDDVFIYIDGQLVLDLGGIHNTIAGAINFCTGEVSIAGITGSKLYTSYAGDCYANTTGGIGAPSDLYSLLDTSRAEFSKTNHVLTVVYYERGANESNCRIKCNFDLKKTTTAEYEGLKVDSKNNGLAGATFALYTDSECKKAFGTSTATSDSKGTIKFTGLPEGEYYMKETVAPTGYALSDGIWVIKVTNTGTTDDPVLSAELYAYNSVAATEEVSGVNNTTTEVTHIKNRKPGTDVTFTKASSKSTSQTLGGATFELDEADGTTVYSSATSDDNGLVTFKNVEVGEYTLKETTAPNGYDKCTLGVWKVTVSSSGTDTYTYSITAINSDAQKMSLATNDAEVKDSTTSVTKILNAPTESEEPTIDKIARVSDYDARTYTVTLSANAEGTTETTYTETVVDPVDVILVLDATYSMYFPSDLKEYARGTTQLDKSQSYYFITSGSSATNYRMYYDNGWKYKDASLDYKGSGSTGNVIEVDNSTGGTAKLTVNGTTVDLYTDSTYSTLATSLKEDGTYYYYGLNSQWYKLCYYNNNWCYCKSNQRVENNGKLSNVPYLTDKISSYEYYRDSVDNGKLISTFYTSVSGGKETRLTKLQAEAKNFVSSLAGKSSKNKIGIVYFNRASGTLCDVVSLDSDGVTKLNTAIDKTLVSNLGAGTTQSLGLSQAETMLSSLDDTNSKYIVTITDGCPTTDKTDCETAIKTVVGNHSNVTFLSIGIDVDEVVMPDAVDILKAAASSDDYAYVTTSASLDEIFSSVLSEIEKTGTKKYFKRGDVYDYIDSRFELVGTAESYGAKEVKKEDGTVGLLWENVLLDNWNKVITLRAKSDFMGGNAITTNAADSKVVIENKDYEFPKPTVDVKLLQYELQDGSEIKFLGDDVSGNADSVQIIKDSLNVKTSDSTAKTTVETLIKNGIDISTLLKGESITVDYAYTGTTDVVGQFVYSLTGMHANDSCLDDSEYRSKSGKATDYGAPVHSYTLKVEYKPLSTAQHLATGQVAPYENDNYEVDPESDDGTYNIYVISVQLDVIKYTENSDQKLADAQYSLQKKEGDNWINICTLTSGSGDDLGHLMMYTDNPSVKTQLSLGTYKLTETVAPSAHALSDKVYYITVFKNDDDNYEIKVTSDEAGEKTAVDEVTNKEIESKEIDVASLVSNASTAEKVYVATFNVRDKILYSLPHTGGSGVYIYTIGGILLMILAALLLYKNKNNKNK